MLIIENLNVFMDSRNLGREFNERQTLNKLEFITGRYHVLREIYQKFDRVFSVKRISLYLKSRARPAIKTTLPISQNFTTRVGPQTALNTPTEIQFTTSVFYKIVSSK